MKTNRSNFQFLVEEQREPATADASLFSTIQIILLVSAVVLRQAAD